MRIADMMAGDGHIFMKSEWGLLNDDWPCVSFTKKSVGDRLRAQFKPGRDALIYVGTTNPENTPDPNHRSRILSAVVIQPNQVLETQKLVPTAAWGAKVNRWGNRWPYAMAVLRAANISSDPLPDAHDVAPEAYRSFGAMQNRGGIVEAFGDERLEMMSLPVEEIELHFPPPVLEYLRMVQAIDPTNVAIDVRRVIAQMAVGIEERVRRGDELELRINPQRFAPNLSDLISMLTAKWATQRGTCMLCGGKFLLESNSMLRPSPRSHRQRQGGVLC